MVSDLEYDLLSVLQSKLEALDAYEVYMDDADEAGDDELRSLFEEIRTDDERHANRLREHLVRVLGAASGGQ